MSSSESNSHFDSEPGEGSYSSPLHSPLRSPNRHSESDGPMSADGGPQSPSSSATAAAAAAGGVPLPVVKRIVATQTDVLPFTPDGLYALAKVSELFVDFLLRCTWEHHDNVGYDEMANVIQNDDDFSFLHDFFPTRITFAEAQAKAAEKEQDDEDD